MGGRNDRVMCALSLVAVGCGSCIHLYALVSLLMGCYLDASAGVLFSQHVVFSLGSRSMPPTAGAAGLRCPVLHCVPVPLHETQQRDGSPDLAAGSSDDCGAADR
jgi:hypothetical protein